MEIALSLMKLFLDNNLLQKVFYVSARYSETAVL